MTAVICFLMLLALAVSAGAEQTAAGQDSFVYTDDGKRDPFWPLITDNGTIINYDDRELMGSDMVLQGIMAGTDGNVAIINSKVVKEGEMLGAFHIKKITPTAVVLDNGQERIELQLRKEE
ncbi:MAG TPA: hypothetical protein VLJ10_04445 [Candidatus Bathyarchaeia archaeon]|nr:hypothetical protein [Candidatus Bathyarchaeia archaeon]